MRYSYSHYRITLINSSAWWIRIFDFPRIQIAALALLAIVLASIYINFNWKLKFPLLLILVASLVYQLLFVIVYAPLYKTQAKKSCKQNGENSFTLLVSNIRMDNDDKELLIIGKKIRETKNPSVVADDLKDVGWSGTSNLFTKYSGLVDPCEGRGLFNTYKVSNPLLRYPLDHIFHFKEFGLLTP